MSVKGSLMFRKLFKRKTVTGPRTLVVQHDELSGALAELASAVSGAAYDTGTGFTCSEADAIARVLVLAGHKDDAVNWLVGHAQGDEVDDLHFTYDETDPDDEGRVLTEAELVEYVEELAA